MAHFFISAALFVVAGIVVYLVAMAWDAKHDIKSAPKADMYLCDKHGAFPASYAFNLTGMTDEPIKQCPMCMEDRFKSARNV